MNVTVVCDVLGSENNGTTIAAMNLIRALKDKGHQVNVVCPDTDRQGESGFYVTPKMHFGRFIDKYVEKNAWLREMESFGKLESGDSLTLTLLSPSEHPHLKAYVEYYIFGRYHISEVDLKTVK